MIEKIKRIVALSFAMLLVMLLPKYVQALENESIKRLSGANRYDTAISISKSGWDSSDYVVLASGENFPDAITSTPLAKLYNAPILLTRMSKLTSQTKDEIVRLKCKNVFIVGGTGVISKDVEEELKEMKINVKRLGGSNRYETSILIANEIMEKSPTQKIVAVSGNDYANAESIAPLAGISNMPIILISEDKIPDCIKEFISEKEITKTYLVGTDNQFTEEVKEKLPNVKYVDGENKYDVNLNIISMFKNEFNFDKIYVATGQNYPDALAASAIAAKDDSPLLLAGDRLYSYTEDFINQLESVTEINLVGGEAILSSYVVKNIKIHSKDKNNNESDNNVEEEQNDEDEQKKLIICLDPGQEQSSIQGVNGVKASDINLSVALRAGAILRNKGYKVVYTRTEDDVPWDKQDEIKEKFKIIHESKADVFVSIHCNYTENNNNANGIETWYNPSNQDSKILAQYLQDNLIKNTSSNDRSVKLNGENGSQAILNNVDIASALVELGFLSNEEEEQRLSTKDFQEKAAEGIANAIIEYNNHKNNGNAVFDNRIDDIIKHIKVGDKFTLPQNVSKIIENGTTKQFSIKWDNDKVDTSKAGVFVYSGTVTETNQKIYLALIINTSSSPKFKVCIDAGHGGYDPGAIGNVKKVKEKDVTLPVALKLGDLLVKNGVDVYFTRISDNVPWPPVEIQDLQKRCDISNAIKPDLYISIHCNAYGNTRASGTETYYFYDSSEGYKAASYVQNSLIKYNGLIDRKIKAKGYYVLDKVDATSILTELAFVTNPKEEELLSSTSFQNKCAEGLCSGILKYLKSK